MKKSMFTLIVEVDYRDVAIGKCMYQGKFKVWDETFYGATQQIIKWIDNNYGKASEGYRINHINDYPVVCLG